MLFLTFHFRVICNFLKDTSVKKIIIVLVIVISGLVPARVNSQAQYADSLRQIISALPDNLEKVEILISLARYYSNINFDTLKARGQQAYDLARKLDNRRSLAEAAILLGFYYKLRNNFEEALHYYNIALHLGDSLEFTLVVAKSSLNISGVLLETADYDESRGYSLKSLASYSQLNDTSGIIASYNNLGMTYMYKGEYDSAAYFFDQGIQISEKTVKKLYLSNLYFNLSDVYNELGELEQAKKYCLKTLEIYEKSNNKRGMGNANNRLGMIERQLKNYDESIQYYEKALSLLFEARDSLRMADIWNNLGALNKEINNYVLAEEYFEKALTEYMAMKFPKGIVTVLVNQASLLMLKGKYQEAIATYEEAIAKANMADMTEDRLKALFGISQTYEKFGNYHKAYEYQSRYYALHDSVFSLEKQELINDLVFKYEKEQDQARILALENENLAKDLVLKKKTLQRNAFLYAGLTIIALAIFLFLYFHQRRVKDRIISDQKIRQLEEEKKLMAAKLLVEGQELERKRIATELHDGLGVLLSATKMQFSTILDKSPESRELIDKATKMLEQASGDVRKISHNMMPGLLTKLGFYEAVGDLFDHLDDSGKLVAECTITGEHTRLAENREIMLYRIIQEMVNNTIRHSEARNVSLHIHVLPDMLDIMFSDDGKGFDFEKMLESQSIGLKSIQSRVSFLNGELHIESAPSKGTRYNMRIPV